jgi:crossover junction endodeoxyribonuclease RuvC
VAIRLLGLDPGLRHTGWGVIDVDGSAMRAVANGVVSAEQTLPMSERLHFIFRGVAAVIEEHKPDECAIEETFVNRNPVSTLKLGHARAAAMLAAAEADLAVHEYAPNLVKKSIVGTGHADKVQISAMVNMLLPIVKPQTADAADALAVAICHAHHRATATVLTAAGAGQIR